MISSKQITVKKSYSLKGHKDCVYTLEKSGEDAIFFSGAGDGMVIQWNLKDPEHAVLLAKVPTSIYALHYTEEQNQLLIGQNYDGIHIIDLKSKKDIGSVKITKAPIFDIKTFKDKIFVASGEGKVTVLHYQNLAILFQLRESSESARCISINPQTGEFAVGYSDNKIRIFDVNTYKLKQVIEAHNNSVFTVRYSPDLKHLLSGGRDAQLKSWSVDRDYALEETVVTHMYAINHMDFRNDDKYFVTCSMDKSIKVWDLQRFRLLKVIDKARYAGHATSINRLLWSEYQDENIYKPLISASDDRTVSVWEINFNEE